MNQEKPTLRIPWVNPNIYHLIYAAKTVLRRADRNDDADELGHRGIRATSYDEALEIIKEYVEIC